MSKTTINQNPEQQVRDRIDQHLGEAGWVVQDMKAINLNAGQLVPQDPNDEPASVLLERLKAEKAQRIGSKSARNSTRKTRSVHKEVN